MKPKKPNPGESLAEINPELAKQWHPTKNKYLTPYDVGTGSNKKVWWKCPDGEDHEWKANIGHRNKGTGCPICTGQKVVRSNSLATLNPELAKQWHPTKNGNFTPYDVRPGSNKKVWWKCQKGSDHEWKVSVQNRSSGWGCPICSGRKVVRSNSLATLNPELARQWHPIKNGNLSPYDVTLNSQKKVWWKCPKGADHEWDAIIADRNNGIGCAICSNYKVVKSNCLSTLNPELAKEWHPTKNGKLTPEDVHPGSSKKVWWKCPEGDDHEWKTVVYSRTGGKGCPICDGKKVVNSTCLATLNFELAKEWHPTKNGNLTPNDIGPNSSKRVWWKCPKGEDHEWKTSVHRRNSGDNCPICSNQKVVLSNCLATLNPELAKQWHPTNNGKLTPYDVGAGSGKVVWWKCPEGEDHEWKGVIGKRNNGKGCPICIGRKVVRSNCLATLNPELAKQWHPTKNGDLTPYDVRPGSTKKVWWKCITYEKHIWKTSVVERNKGTGCPECKSPISAPELRIFCEIKSIFPSTQHRKIIAGYEVDIYIPEVHFGIEYDGVYWHKDKIEKDQEKNLALQSEILLLRIREKGLPKLSNTDIELKTTNISAALIKKILQFILKNRQIESSEVLDRIHKYLKRKDWIASEQFVKLLAQKNKVVFEKSISFLFPDLAKQWHPTKNGPLLPEHFTPGSHKKVWWKCQKGEDHEWKAIVASRSKGLGCPICRGLKVVKSNCLATLNPELTKQWHPTKNKDLTPYNVTPGSDKKVWWKCPEGDDHEWEANIDRRNKGAGCPICTGQETVLSNCLATLNPELAKQWHPTKNKDLTPYDVTTGSNTKAWWKCPKGDDHEWEAAITARSGGSGCPICTGQKTVLSNCLATLHPELAKQWHPTKNGPLVPEHFAPGSDKKVWWKCSKGDDHEWEAIIGGRVRGNGCPVCTGRKAVKSNCLATLNPELAKQWHPTKNKDLTPYDVTPGSHKKVWWQDYRGYEWEAIIRSRVKKERNWVDPDQLTLFED